MTAVVETVREDIDDPAAGLYLRRVFMLSVFAIFRHGLRWYHARLRSFAW
jgi:hypothetical protein